MTTIQLESYVGRIVFNEEEDVREPQIETFDIQSHISNIDTSLTLSKSISYFVESYTLPISTGIEVIEQETNAQIRQYETFVGKIVSNYSITTYNQPMTYKAHLQHIENKTNVYHIE